ncbi:hypothetical protein [Asanoa hainanensis]|uniref:hypothetical protein n=1 Tax=Asanoa hainanensis TaxID=560556 RepID=UPI00117F8CA1|nr:hypothetical protein [Asanoa hainanensis]
MVAAATAGGFAVASGPAAISPAAKASAAPSPRSPVPSTLRGVEPTETTAHAIARLKSAIPRAIRDAVPGVRLGRVPTVIRRTVPASPTGDGGTYRARLYYDMPTPLAVQVAGKQGDISISVERLIVDSSCEPTTEDPGARPNRPSRPTRPERSCVETEGPAGERVVTSTLVGPSSDSVVIDMRVDRPDGSMVSIYLDSPKGSVFTVEQLLAIALDRRVSFYP